MKKIGLIGGISWQSTIEYYRILNTLVAEKLGQEHAAKILLDSLDFGEIDDFIKKNDFEGMTKLVVSSAKALEQAGAELLLIGANTMHFIAPEVQSAIRIPLIHIADATIKKIHEEGLKTVGLLGTRFTMEKPFYKQKYEEAGIHIIIPDSRDREFIQDVIFTELFRAYINPESKKRYLEIIDKLADKGAEGVILGCTEIPLLIHQEDCSIPVFDTTTIHAEAAVEFALAVQ